MVLKKPAWGPKIRFLVYLRSNLLFFNAFLLVDSEFPPPPKHLVHIEKEDSLFNSNELYYNSYDNIHRNMVDEGKKREYKRNKSYTIYIFNHYD